MIPASVWSRMALPFASSGLRLYFSRNASRIQFPTRISFSPDQEMNAAVMNAAAAVPRGPNNSLVSAEVGFGVVPSGAPISTAKDPWVTSVSSSGSSKARTGYSTDYRSRRVLAAIEGFSFGSMARDMQMKLMNYRAGRDIVELVYEHRVKIIQVFRTGDGIRAFDHAMGSLAGEAVTTRDLLDHVITPEDVDRFNRFLDTACGIVPELADAASFGRSILEQAADATVADSLQLFDGRTRAE